LHGIAIEVTLSPAMNTCN